jgi:hypothetical protein
MKHQLHNLASMHIMTDLSLWAPSDATAAALNTYSRAHEASLARALPGVEPFAFTVTDFIVAWPSVVDWPTPGSAAFPVKSYDAPTRTWLHFVERALQNRGLRNFTRLVHGAETSNLLSYYLHAPSLCLWLRRRKALSQPLPSYVWAIEEDTPIVGSLATPLTHYMTSSTADLLTVLMPHTHANALTRHLYSNGRFRDSIPGFVHMWEHVERFSSRLLKRLDEVLSTGAAAFGEFFAPTVCNATEWCTCADLRSDGFVQRQGALYAWSQPVTRPTLKRLMSAAERVRKQPGYARWVHGVQGVCDVVALAECAGGPQRENCTLPKDKGDGLWVPFRGPVVFREPVPPCLYWVPTRSRRQNFFSSPTRSSPSRPSARCLQCQRAFNPPWRRSRAGMRSLTTR